MADLNTEELALHNAVLDDGKTIIANTLTVLDSAITGVTADIVQLTPEALQVAVDYAEHMLPPVAQGAVKAFAGSFIDAAESGASNQIEAKVEAVSEEAQKYLGAAAVRLKAAI